MPARRLSAAKPQPEPDGAMRVSLSRSLGMPSALGCGYAAISSLAANRDCRRSPRMARITRMRCGGNGVLREWGQLRNDLACPARPQVPNKRDASPIRSAAVLALDDSAEVLLKHSGS